MPAPSNDYRIVIDRSVQEVMRGERSLISERTVGRLTWSDDDSGLTGRFEIDSVRFVRDGEERQVAPAGAPVARFVFHSTQSGEFVLDSLPDGVEEYPYLSTVALELPLLRPRGAQRHCEPGSTWSDSVELGPVPVPGVDSLFSRYHTRYRTQSDSGKSLFILGRSEISRDGRSAGATVLIDREVRTSRWRLGGGCRGPASLEEERQASLVYPSIREERPDTVTSVERRRIVASGLATR